LTGLHTQFSRKNVAWSARSLGIIVTTAHSEIRNHSVKPLLFSFSDPNKSQTDEPPAHPLHTSPVNHERRLQAWHSNA
jgi:hypothetical protein